MKTKEEFIREWSKLIRLPVEKLDAVKCDCSEKCEEWVIKIKVKKEGEE